ncbi:hypothetical protein ACFYNO_14065 [Kitasatospora sp. NPDC006697]|uniref:hypothetical protein n=1 Tax=Kitasatospora sp. NPDC006697 TaxID=3364020 RepID=UPI0036B7DC77
MAGGSDGYRVNLDALDRVTGHLGQVSSDLATANTDYTAALCHPASAFGEFDMDRAALIGLRRRSPGPAA